MSFIDDPGIKMLAISINNAGMLMPYLNEFPSITSGKGKICYFIRREEMIDLTPENMTEVILFFIQIYCIFYNTYFAFIYLL